MTIKPDFILKNSPPKLPQHAAQNPNVCLLAVNSGRLFWIKALFKGSFAGYPAIKLYGKLRVKRKASEKEIARLNRRMKGIRGLKGNTYMWKNMEWVREIEFTESEKINLEKMTEHL